MTYRQRFPNSTPGHRHRMPEFKKASARRMRHRPTAAESALWDALRGRQLDGLKFRNQAPLYGWIADFWCPSERLVVEVDGPYHAERRAEDAVRDRVMAGYDITVVRVTNDQVLNDLPSVLALIRAAIPGGGR